MPAHLRNNWLNFQVELMLIFGLLIYLANYLFGKSKNQSLANSWFEQHRNILEENFYVVGEIDFVFSFFLQTVMIGDNGVDKEPSQGIMLRDSDHQYTLWCSGRSACRGKSFAVV